MFDDETAADHEEPVLVAPEPTGHAEIDEVVVAVAALREMPLEQHVAVFEDAHTRLRRALDDRS